MYINDLRKHFKQETIDSCTYINPLQVAERQEFARFARNEEKDYRQRAIDFVVGEKLPFSSTWNSLYEICKKFIKVSCPYCQGETECNGGGGSGDSYTVNFSCCKCTARVSLDLNYKSFYAKPNP